MSPRAAWRLDRLGFPEVHDYEAGKSDWLAHGLDYEGEADLVSRHLEDAATCDVDQQVAAIRQRLGSGLAGCIVLADGLAVGALRADADDTARAGEVMAFGVSTVRPSEEVDGLVRRMADARVERAVVTDPSGRFLGVFRHRQVPTSAGSP